uniref:Lipocalin n=1 Tax=Rhipicephalus zambeziensis TaxID=60191 RepID=A0A224YHW4_9ACAR
MKDIMSIFTVVFLLGLAGATVDRKLDFTFEEVFSSLPQHGKLWVQQRSFHGEGLRCIFSEKVLLVGQEYVFYKYHKSGEKLVRVTAHGQIYKKQMKKGLKSAMNVRVKELPILTYILQYWDKNELCGVITFLNSSGQKECELHSRVRVRKHFKNCLVRYRRHCQNGKYKEYLIDNEKCEISGP